MLPATLAMSLANTPLAQQFAILYQLGVPQLATQGGELSAAACFFIWAQGLLSRVPFLSEHARYQIMELLIEEKKRNSAVFDDVCALASYRLAISDKRFVATELAPHQYLDTKTGEMVSALPSPPLEAIIYDLAELFRRNAAHCKKAAANELGPDQQVAGGVVEP